MTTLVTGNGEKLLPNQWCQLLASFRNGSAYPYVGRSLVNCSAIEIMKLHRFVREVEGNELSELETYPLLEQIAKMKLLPCEVILGK